MIFHYEFPKWHFHSKRNEISLTLKKREKTWAIELNWQKVKVLKNGSSWLAGVLSSKDTLDSKGEWASTEVSTGLSLATALLGRITIDIKTGSDRLAQTMNQWTEE